MPFGLKLFLNVCKQNFHISHVRISEKVKDVLMWNLWHIIFKWRRRYWQIFKSALVCLSILFALTIMIIGTMVKFRTNYWSKLHNFIFYRKQPAWMFWKYFENNWKLLVNGLNLYKTFFDDVNFIVEVLFSGVPCST